ncbi:MAG: glycosyltransferase [Prevotellaceae bacterium]|nr:glycosyltransferase [Prevotellaceae bacterium]
MFFTVFVVAITLTYCFLILHFVSGWDGLPEEKTNDETGNLFVSVVIPFRNEAENLPHLLEKIAAQTYRNFELILVNDHSSDEFKIQDSTCKLINAQGFGKKSALKEGIAQARGELIVCTDADCLPSANWLKSIVQFAEKSQAGLIICPVRLASPHSVFEKLQTLEFVSLIVSGAGAAAVGMPILCNGANLAFRPETWQKSLDELAENEVSGDDMFLLISTKRRGEKIAFLKSRDAMLETSPCKTLSDFFNQRKRWAGKAKSYTDWQILSVSSLVFALSALQVGFFAAGFFSPNLWKTAAAIWLIKTAADTCLLFRARRFFAITPLLKFIPVLSVVYPFYVLWAAVGGLFGHFRWKER